MFKHFLAGSTALHFLLILVLGLRSGPSAAINPERQTFLELLSVPDTFGAAAPSASKRGTFPEPLKNARDRLAQPASWPDLDLRSAGRRPNEPAPAVENSSAVSILISKGSASESLTKTPESGADGAAVLKKTGPPSASTNPDSEINEGETHPARMEILPLDAGNSITRPPALLYSPPEFYPPLARGRGWEGVVTLELLIDSNGKVVRSKVVDSSGYQLLDQAALKAVKLRRYQPALRNGRPVEFKLLLNYTWRLTDENT